MTTPQDADSSPSPNYSPPPWSLESQNRPLMQLCYILQFSGATRSSARASTTSRNGFHASTSNGHGFVEPSSTASTSNGHGSSTASTSNGHGFVEPSATASTSNAHAASTSNGHGIVEPSDAASRASRNGFHAPTGSGFYGPAGAAAMLLMKDGWVADEHAVVLHRFRLGLGNQRISVAEYRGLILGLTETLRKGYTEIIVQGNSELVVNQFLGNWEIHDPELRALHDQALELRNRFHPFSINHIDENLSHAVNEEAVRAISLPEGQVEVE